MARRKSSRRKRSRNINLRILETGGGLVIAQRLGLTGAAMDLWYGNTSLEQAVTHLAERAAHRDTQVEVIKAVAGVGIARWIAKSMRIGQIASIGPLKLRV